MPEVIVPSVTISIPRSTALFLAGLPAIVPVAFMVPPVFSGNSPVLENIANDVLGSAGACLFFAMLLISPISTISGARWFNPALRQWYGIMFAVTIIIDAIIAMFDQSFAGGVAGRITGHTFLAVGFTMVCVSIPLLITANRAALRRLGKYWRPIQKAGTYLIWALLALHLALLEGFGVAHGNALGPDKSPYNIFHQRFYQVCAVSAFLIAFRVPSVTRWATHKRRAGQAWKVYLLAAPLFALFLLGYVFIINELIFKGVIAFTQTNLDD